MDAKVLGYDELFQSTLPVWGGTKTALHFGGPNVFQSTLPVWGGTRKPLLKSTVIRRFQSTLPVWGGTSHLCKLGGGNGFQSTLPVWGGTQRFLRAGSPVAWQTPLPRWCGARTRSAIWLSPSNFNPPSPCGEGPAPPADQTDKTEISIHPPRVGRDLGRGAFTAPPLAISIHPPRVGRDSKSSQKFFVNFCARR